MAKRSLSEQLDQAVEAILAHAEVALPTADAALAPLLRLAAVLRDLPSKDFRQRLKADLIRRATMTTATLETARKEIQTVTPYLTVQNLDELIEFTKRAFDAEELVRGGPGSAGGLHVELRIGDSTLMLGGGPGWRGQPQPTSLHHYVKDVDAVYQRALKAGGISIEEPVDQFYGDREAGVKDPAGNNWYIATHQGENYIPEGMRVVTPFLQPRGAGQLIDFLKRAFGAEESACHRGPDGTVMHAKVKIGDSIIEMGEAHGPIQPMPTVFYVRVPKVDAAYEQAVQAGAGTLSAPADQPYGHRVAAVSDGFGNSWYLAAPIEK